jgi:alpha-ketoglutarate-dependent sulfate ester dioxygenase
MNRSQLEIHPVAGRIGAEIVGVDLRAELDDEVIAAIRSALLLWKVVFFRNQALDADAHAAVARRFGPITTAHPTVPGLAENRHVLDIDAAEQSVASVWHTDVTFVDRPPMGSILRALVVPAYGGDTLWANTASAYQDLSADLRDAADSLHAVHTNEFDYSAPPRPDDDEKLREYARVFQSTRYETTHPIVQVHPETGERALLLGGFARQIVGLSPAESKDLLRRFRSRVERPENVVRWRWRLGDVAFWDNRATQHRAIADFGRRPRRLQRVTIAGEVPVGINGVRSTSLNGDSSAYTPAEVRA